MKINGKSFTHMRIFNRGVMNDEVTEGMNSRGEIAVFNGRQINIALMRRVGNFQLFDRKLIQHGDIRDQSDTVIDGNKTDYGTVLLHLAYDIRSNLHLFKQGIQQRTDAALLIIIHKGFLL